MSDCFPSLTHVAVVDVFLDQIPHVWPVILSLDEFGSFCCSSVSCCRDVVMLFDKFYSQLIFVGYPYLSLIS